MQTVQTVEYKGARISGHAIDANRVVVHVDYLNIDGTARRSLKRHESVSAAKAHLTRRLNRLHGEALLINALRDIARGIWNPYMGETLEERTNLHYAHIRYSQTRARAA
jgi:hypothetical protein